MSRKKAIGTPVQYPEGHPYNDPRRRAADAVGMLGALHSAYGEKIEDQVREFVGFMWAVEGRKLTPSEIAAYRRSLAK